MSKTLRIVVGVVIVLIGIAIIVGSQMSGGTSNYPKPASLPPVVDEQLEPLLAKLDKLLVEKYPAVANSLRPGLTDQQIDDLEQKLGDPLSAEIRTLYRWHDGMEESGVRDFVPGHRFQPLEEAVEYRLSLRSQLENATATQRAAFNAVAGHTLNWLPILSDPAGDGYFYDPSRVSEGGEIFWTMAEAGGFRFFPSLSNLFAGIHENFQAGSYTLSEDGLYLEEDDAATSDVWSKYGTQVVD